MLLQSILGGLQGQPDRLQGWLPNSETGAAPLLFLPWRVSEFPWQPSLAPSQVTPPQISNQSSHQIAISQFPLLLLAWWWDESKLWLWQFLKFKLLGICICNIIDPTGSKDNWCITIGTPDLLDASEPSKYTLEATESHNWMHWNLMNSGGRLLSSLHDQLVDGLSYKYTAHKYRNTLHTSREINCTQVQNYTAHK